MASGSKKVIIAALIGNSLISVTKFIASAMTGSSAMMSEGVHSLVDTGNQILLLYGLKKAKQPADERYPFGHGKEIYFWSFIVAILIFAVGSGISIYEGIHRIQDPSEISNPMINYIVLGLAIIFEAGAFWFAFVEFNKQRGNLGYVEAVQRGKDPSIFVVLFEDSAALLGLVVAMVGLMFAQVTGDYWWDGVASVVIGFILGGTAIWLAVETKGLLIGEGADQETILGIKSLLIDQEGIDHLNEVLTLHMGPEFILVTVSVRFSRDMQVGQLEKVVQNVDASIKDAYPFVKRVFIEAEKNAEVAS